MLKGNLLGQCIHATADLGLLILPLCSRWKVGLADMPRLSPAEAKLYRQGAYFKRHTGSIDSHDSLMRTDICSSRWAKPQVMPIKTVKNDLGLPLNRMVSRGF